MLSTSYTEKQTTEESCLRVSCHVRPQKNQSKFQNTAYWLVDIQIWIDFLQADMMGKVTFKQGTSLACTSIR